MMRIFWVGDDRHGGTGRVPTDAQRALLRLDGVDVVGTASSLTEVTSTALGLGAHVVLVDLTTRDPGEAAAQELADLSARLRLPVLCLTGDDTRLCTQCTSVAVSCLASPFDDRLLAAHLELALLRYVQTGADLAQSPEPPRDHSDTLAALESSQRHFAGLIDASPVGVFETNADGHCTYVNETWMRITGLTADTALGTGWTRALHPKDRDHVFAEWNRATAEREAFRLEYRFTRTGAEDTWVLGQAVALREDGAITAYIGTITDLTRHKRAERELAEREELLRLSQAVAHIGSWSLDSDSQRLMWSDEMYRLIGEQPGELPPSRERFFARVHPEDKDKLTFVLDPILAGRHEGKGEYRFVRPDGEIRVHEVSWRRVQPATDDRPQILGVTHDVTEWRAREEQLRLAQFSIEHAAEAFIVADPGARLLSVNRAAASLLGYERDELTTMSVADVILGVTPEGWEQHWHTLRTRDAHSFDCVVRRKDGILVPVEITSNLLRVGGREFNCSMVRDVTVQRQHDDAMRLLSTGLARFQGQAFFDELATRLAAIVGADIVFIAAPVESSDPNLRTFVHVIDGATQAGITYAPTGTPCASALRGELVVIEDSACVRYPTAHFMHAHGVEACIVAPLLSTDGIVTGVCAVLFRHRIPNAERAAAIVKVVAQRAGAERERQRAETRFSGVFEQAPDALLIVDSDGRVLQANHRAESSFGCDSALMHTLSVHDVVPGAFDGRAESKQSHMGSSAPRNVAVHRGVRSDGTLFPCEVGVSPLESDEGRLFVVAIRDVTQRIHVEQEHARLAEQLRQSQKLEALGTLAGGIAHDFNNMLTAISGNVEVARFDLEDQRAVAEHLDQIAAAAARASALVAQILAFSRRQPTVRTVSSLESLVAEVVRLLRAVLPAGIRLRTAVSGDVPSVLIDATQIHQVLMNLGTNAWQAIGSAAGLITITIDSVTATDAITPAAGLPPGRYARVRVADDGAGIDATIVERVFEPFFTTKTRGSGTGLGLAVVHGIVTSHGGAVTVHSAVGVGTTFAVYLPTVEAKRPAASAPNPLHSAPTGRGRVLMVDDEEPVTRVGKRILERLGYEVEAFTAPSEALDAFARAPDSFDVVLTDQNMPGWSGLDVARAVARLRPDLPVVLTSGNAAYTDEELARLSVRCFIPKPYSGAVLSEVFDRLLRDGAPVTDGRGAAN